MPDERILGHTKGRRPGATVLIVAGLHGNEPAGVAALRRIADALPPPDELRGEVLLLAGNVRALREGIRYRDSDLNRGWLSSGPTGSGRERTERDELVSTLDPAIDRAQGAPVVVDFHTTSGPTPPFLTLGDTLRNRAFAEAVPLPIVLGLEEQLTATFLEYVNNRGCITLGCEGGSHRDPAAAGHLEAVAWLVLAHAGVVERDSIPMEDPEGRLAAAARGYPSVVEVRYRQDVPRDRRLRLEPGLRSFQPVRAGQLLGRWEDGEPVHAPEAGRILMPLYQDQGDDGFFIIRDVRRFWLRLSALLRRARADRIAPLLPGVRKHPEQPNAVVVDRRVARWFTVELFHLLGYRRRLEQGDELVLTRRHFDDPPFRT